MQDAVSTSLCTDTLEAGALAVGRSWDSPKGGRREADLRVIPTPTLFSHRVSQGLTGNGRGQEKY